MTTDMILQTCELEAGIIEDLMEPWKRNRAAAELAGAYERMLPRLIELCRHLEAFDEAFVKDLLAGHIRNVQDAGEALLNFLDRLLRTFEEIRNSCEELRKAGYSISHLEDFQQVLEGGRRTRTHLAERWPWIDENVLARSRTDLAAGRCRPAKEAFNELRGPAH